ncbi:MAG: phage holin family protein [Christensenellales bacterium]|jgi:hypothetical protein
MDVMGFLNDAGIFVLMAVYVICSIVKGIPRVPNWIIPIIAVSVGAVLGVFVIGNDAHSIIMGGLAGWAAVGANQTLKQSIDRDPL